MIRYKIVAVGKIKENYLKEAISEYAKRISRFAAMEIPIPVPQIRIPFSHSPLKIAFATALPYSG